jgi:hypothetical protein
MRVALAALVACAHPPPPLSASGPPLITHALALVALPSLPEARAVLRDDGGPASPFDKPPPRCDDALAILGLDKGSHAEIALHAESFASRFSDFACRRDAEQVLLPIASAWLDDSHAHDRDTIDLLIAIATLSPSPERSRVLADDAATIAWRLAAATHDAKSWWHAARSIDAAAQLDPALAALAHDAETNEARLPRP